jgi:hypothetical protein
MQPAGLKNSRRLYRALLDSMASGGRRPGAELAQLLAKTADGRELGLENGSAVVARNKRYRPR